ncbi:hypothetical protein ARMGADRAFT_1031496 [Armillaria gallica]|uniref:Heterokaryon incompatibility domain-containing protein n=1 Tax=Armillaria gallica TaxID=47427 RepID=A0A2H3DSF4_ARMGA|nr:hypothetical protein ARMGADRAFT_1031496 [Armillaria gallica]
MLAPSSFTKLISKPLRSVFTTPQTKMDSALSMTAVSDQNTDIIGPSEPQGEIVHPTQSAGDFVGVLDDGDDYGRNYRDEWVRKSARQAGQKLITYFQGITLPRVTISAFIETGQAEASIKVPKQRSYIVRRPVIQSCLANTPLISLGIQGVIDRLNATLGTSHTLNTPSLLSLLKECIERNYDFSTYGTHRDSNIQDELHRREEDDREMRRKALIGNVIVHPDLVPRRVWDLYSNRVVPYWIAETLPTPISHAWVDVDDRVNDTNLNLIRIEMLNLGKDYVWLDVLCLQQNGGRREDLRAEEWKIDVPTIGYIYRFSTVLTYLGGLGRPLSLKVGDLDSDRCWFRCAWTVQEVGFWGRIIAGDTPDGPMHAKPIDDDGNYKTDVLTRFHKQLKSLHTTMDIFSVLTAMRDRVSMNPMDRVARLALLMMPRAIPAYYESGSLEDAWTVLVNTTHDYYRGLLLFVYPGVGLRCKKWRPTWDRVMTEPLPTGIEYCSSVERNDNTDEDCVEGPCIEQGLLRRLDEGSADGVDRQGELVVKDADGMAHTFKICVTHQFPIPEDTYTLLRSLPLLGNRDKKSLKYCVVG